MSFRDPLVNLKAPTISAQNHRKVVLEHLKKLSDRVTERFLGFFRLNFRKISFAGKISCRKQYKMYTIHAMILPTNLMESARFPEKTTIS